MLGGSAVLVGAIAFTVARAGDAGSPAPAPKPPRPVPARTLTGQRYGGNLPGAPEVIRVARDGTVWTILRRDGHTSLARLEGRSLHDIPLSGIEPTDLVEGYRRTSPYLVYGARRSVGSLLPDGTVAGHTTVPGDVRDIALDRFGTVWFTDRARSALGVWDGRHLTERLVSAQPRPQLEDIVLGGAGSSKLWFLDFRGRVGLVDPVGGPVRMFEAVGGHPTLGPSRLTGSFAGAAVYATNAGVGRVSEEGRSRVLVHSFPSAPGALAGGPDGNLWVAARRGPWLFRVSPSGSVARYTLDLPTNARLRDLTRDNRHGDLWIACARPRALLRVAVAELRSKLR